MYIHLYIDMKIHKLDDDHTPFKNSLIRSQIYRRRRIKEKKIVRGRA